MSNPSSEFLTRTLPGGPGRPPRTICRLGLATRGHTGLTRAAVYHAVERGVNFLNWCGQRDGMSQAIADLGIRRRDVAVCVQFEARSASEAKAELCTILRELRTDYVDVLTFYYVEAMHEWASASAGRHVAASFQLAGRVPSSSQLAAVERQVGNSPPQSPQCLQPSEAIDTMTSPPDC